MQDTNHQNEPIPIAPKPIPSIIAVVLAAGLSRRMGEQNKLLLTIGSQTMIEKVVDTVLQSNVEETIVVLGHEAIKIQRVLRGKSVKMLKNTLYQFGMTTSIKAGIQVASTDVAGYMIVLGDLAQIEVSELNLMIEAFGAAIEDEKQGQEEEEKTPIVIPTFEGKRGNPVIFSVHFREVILKHSEMNGCKGIVEANEEQVIEVEMSQDHILKDIDTPEDYKIEQNKLKV